MDSSARGDNIDALIRDVFGYGDAQKKGITEELTEDLLNADASDRIDFYADSRGKLLPAAYKEWLGTSKRDELLGSVNHPKLKKAIDELYRPGSIIGDGGTADIIRFENATGILMSRAGHIRKGIQRIKQMQRIIDGNELSREIVSAGQTVSRFRVNPGICFFGYLCAWEQHRCAGAGCVWVWRCQSLAKSRRKWYDEYTESGRECVE
mgnify:CR=1 FL=1